MELKLEIKKKILTAIGDDRRKFESDAKHAIALGINKATYAQIKQGKTDRVISDAELLRIGRKLNVNLVDSKKWITAETPVFSYITQQLEHCRIESTTAIFCDRAGIGKTHAAQEFQRKTPNVAYIDASLSKGKKMFLRSIAQAFGVDFEGKLIEVQQDLIYYIKTLPAPIIIIDEAGDLEYSAFLELKALYNALEDCCGFYMMGADGLKAKIDRNRRNNKVGYAEIFDRFGARYNTITPNDQRDLLEWNKIQAKMVIEANLNGLTPQYAGDILSKSQLSLRRVRKEIFKIKSGKLL